MSNRLNRKVAELEGRIERLEQFLYGEVGEAEAPVQEEGQEEGQSQGAEPVGELEEQVSLQEKYGEGIAELLYGAGYTSVAMVESASDEELRAVDGIGAATLRKIREAG